MSYQYVVYEKSDHIARVTINRPEVMNAVHPPAHMELDEIWNDFQGDPQMWVAILTGAGDRAFCAGADLKYAAEHPSVRRVPATPRGFGGLTNRFDLYKPVIAAVNGYALGGGMEMMLACDIVVAAEHATFGQPEPRVGRMAPFGGVVRLARQVPFRQAMGLILTGERITAQEALRMGLVNQVVPLSGLKPTVDRWAGKILECSPLAVQASKEAALRSQDMPLSMALSTNFEYTVRLWNSNEAREGAEAFVQKRKPRWQNP
ncbi:MAG: enoyl-CoA hydratase-related protein [Chloroflexi bacterium]|nr:enoyl-CoA hydratase-related protein [Chloroflexota bacterium]